MNFGKALEALKNGKLVSREGWNGKNMFLKLISSGGYSVKEPITENAIHPLLPFLGMKTADDCFVPWLASQTDILSEDWGVVGSVDSNSHQGKAVFIDTSVEGLYVSFGTDGFWLNFQIGSKHASLNLSHQIARMQGEIAKNTMLEWCEYIEKQHTLPPCGVSNQ